MFDRDETYEHMIEDMAITDPYAMDLLWYGWFDEDGSSDQRRNAREQFFEYTGMDDYDFDWEQWKEWYTTQAA